MLYYKVMSHPDDEILAIFKVNVNLHENIDWFQVTKMEKKELGKVTWPFTGYNIWEQKITQAEFETYQAFGFKEIVLDNGVHCHE